VIYINKPEICLAIVSNSNHLIYFQWFFVLTMGEQMSGKPFAPDEIDIRVGQILAALRKQRGLSQKDMAKKLGVTFQQVHKYETAGNRISISRFYKMLKVLDVSFNSVFTELGTNALYDDDMRHAIDIMWHLDDTDKQILYNLIQRLGQKFLLRIPDKIDKRRGRRKTDGITRSLMRCMEK